MQSFLHKANIEIITNEYKHECDTIYIGLHVLVYKQIIDFRRIVISLFPVKKPNILGQNRDSLPYSNNILLHRNKRVEG